jgi:hypothetical protein
VLPTLTFLCPVSARGMARCRLGESGQARRPHGVADTGCLRMQSDCAANGDRPLARPITRASVSQRGHVELRSRGSVKGRCFVLCHSRNDAWQANLLTRRTVPAAQQPG